MAADSHRTRPKQACLTCKTRKKKCNKGLPSCNYCILKDLECRYVPVTRQRVYGTPNTDISTPTAIRREILTAETIDGPTRTSIPEPATTPRKTTLYRPVFESLDGVHLEVQNIIRLSGEFMDDLTSRYFRNLHGNLPIISRERFQSSLTGMGTPPSADSSILLLTVCLIAYLPNPKLSQRDGDTIGRRSLYLATKALLAQVQGCLQPSISLIQASLLLATYEYANGRPEVALVTIAGCARMAYAAGIHKSKPHNMMDGDSRLEAEEAANTWWGIVISERAFACEIDDYEQPMATILPSGDVQLPIDRQKLDIGDLLSPDSMPNIPASRLTITSIGCFGRAAQASCLLDQVLKALVIPNLTIRLPLLESLDRAIQSFLADILALIPGKGSAYCTALAVTVRTLFKLHEHVLSISQQAVFVNLRSLEEWKKSSLAALDTATTMVNDMAKWHYSILPLDGSNNTSPIYIYVVRASIKHMRTRPYNGDYPWPESSENELQLYLDRLQHQWVTSYDY
ncbi:conserved hypothetical protein [Talaromyces stipitatus ATCC 10500]|uniref:Zn(2)-C6 fungal-type domain-containing protein n=1 Tax=Talaromyces stipitatus (strain ATCC 10500 / CBS 375.48 / QM 6759 / NRRL 1006) TaxID=441959 RepID=B8MRB3_TALSN|nr:uncharacterized protein TSTA_055140 [Talaromyces stipitatus ATCC 10500]EED13008.1 conserved hypothetical protein [Talaromyces stipitatus ATCC 10500]